MEDFQILDSGIRQTIARFGIERIAIRGDEVTQPGGASARTVSSEPIAVPDRFFAFLIDDQDLVPEHVPLAITAAIRILASLQPGDRAAVASASGHTFLDFTSDRAKLRHALEGIVSLGRRATFTGRMNPFPCAITYYRADKLVRDDRMAGQGCAGEPRDPLSGSAKAPNPPEDLGVVRYKSQLRAYAESIVQAGDRDVTDYFSTLSTLIGAMSRLPGQRTIVALSNGMYVPPRFRPLQEGTINAAMRAHVVISGVDPRGVYISNDPDDPSTNSDAWGIGETNERFGFMQDVTSATGGTYTRFDNDIDAGLRRAMETPEFAYVLGFYPPGLKLDGKYHPLSVRLRRAAGLTVQTRSGYFATASGADPAADLKLRMHEAFFSGAESNAIPVRIRSEFQRDGDSDAAVTVAAHVDLQNMKLGKASGRNTNRLSMIVGLFDENGKYINAVEKSIDLRLRDESLEVWRRSGLEVRTGFTLKPGRYLVRLVLRDENGQTMAEQSAGVEFRSEEEKELGWVAQRQNSWQVHPLSQNEARSANDCQEATFVRFLESVQIPIDIEWLRKYHTNIRTCLNRFKLRPRRGVAMSVLARGGAAATLVAAATRLTGSESVNLIALIMAQTRAVLGQQQSGGANAAQAGRGQRTTTAPVAYDDYTGFTKLWDGETFNNWDGETDVWSIDHGAIHADTTKTPGQHHIHYIGPGAVMRDFDLKVEMKMSEKGANGGIQYRSRLLNPAHGGSIDNPLGKNLPSGITTLQQAIAAGLTAVPAAPATQPAGNAAAGGRAPRQPQAPNPWQVSGYQYDMSSDNRYTGQLYEGQGRGIVNPPGGIVILQPGRVAQRIGTVIADPASAVHPHKGLDGEWNQLEVIARGNTLIHMCNGQIITVTIDDDPASRAYQGIMSLQLEGSGQIWYRNVYVKSLDKPMEFPK